MPPQADPFAQYAAQDGNDPFAQYATDQPRQGRESASSWHDPQGTYLGDVARFAGEELKGGGEALLGAVDPRTYYNLGKDVLTNRGRNTLAGFKEIGSQVLQGNPRAIGNVLGGAVAGKALPAMAKAAPDAMVTAGTAIDRGGAALAKSRPMQWGGAYSVMSGNPKGMAVAASPYVAQGAGKILAKGGRILGGGKPAPTKWLPAPEYGPPDASVAPNAGAMSPDDITHQTLLDKLGGKASTQGTGGTIEPAPFVPRDLEPSMADIALSDAREHWGSKNVPGAPEPEVRAGTPLMERDQPRDLSAEPASRIGTQYLDRMTPPQMIEWYNKISATGPFKTEAARQIRARGVPLP